MNRLTDQDMSTVGYKLKLYPTNEQEKIFRRYFGASRFVYNLGIQLQEETREKYLNGESKYSTLSYFNLVDKITKLKQTDEYAWLNEFNSNSITLVMKDVRNAFDKFFEYGNNRPKYRKKKFNHQMFIVRSERLGVNEDTVRIPSIGIVSCDKHNHLEIIGDGNKNKLETTYKHYYNSRVSFDGCDYWLSFSLELNHDEDIEVNSCKRFRNNEVWNYKTYSEPIGIDLGCKQHNWIVDSRGTRIDRPDTSKEEKQIKKYQKKLRHKLRVNDEKMGKKNNSTMANDAKRSKRYYTRNEEKLLNKLNKAYKRVTNKREAVIHNYACSIIAEKPSKIVMETLSVKDMVIPKTDAMPYKKRHNHNKNIYDSMLYNTRVIIERKAKANNIPFVLADREFPSTQICSKCGHRQKIGTNSVYKCPICGLEIDRDLNASYNLRDYDIDIFDECIA